MAADRSSTDSATLVALAVTSLKPSAISYITLTVLVIFAWILPMLSLISSVAVAVSAASVLTSFATTANPLLDSPARAASIVALRARSLVSEPPPFFDKSHEKNRVSSGR